MKKGLDELTDVSKEISKRLPDGGIVLLVGDLASGKSTLVKDFVKFLGLKSDATSPTFSIMNVYEDRVFHYDIYSEGVSKFIESGLLENLEVAGYHFIEWADSKLEEILTSYGFDFLKIVISTNCEKREYSFVA
jgi:tRNA threonylcarbamoyladenosine biosynthesis protein TsaE